MKEVLQKNHRLLFYGLWLLLGLMQSGLTELLDDEAYYWVWGKYLDWGYFDHPPMIALLIKMGSAIFPGEIGVRFFPLLLNLFSLLIIEKLLNKKNPSLFYAIALSMAVIQLMGFAAVPDTPLIFFTALFFLCYKRFVTTRSLINSFLLGLSIALLFYSKYHAILIVVFVLMSNLRLFRRYHIYLAGIIALVLYAPHLWWQYQHDWVSFRYHLFESNVNAYKPSYTFEYIIGQLFLPGPIAGFILLPAAFLYKPKDQLERGLRYSMIGIYIFFLVSSFRGRVEANWTTPALIPLIILAHQFLNERFRWQKMVFRLLPVSLLLVLFARVILVVDILPLKAIKERYHSWKEWPAVMKEKTKGLPVVAGNSYQRASKYWFYTGQMTYSQNYYRERRNNYNFWPVEDSLLGKPVYAMDKYGLARFPDSMETPLGWLGYKYDPVFISFVKIMIDAPRKLSVKEGQSLSFECRYIIPPHYADFIKTHPVLNDSTLIGVFKEPRKWIQDIHVDLPLSVMVDKKTATVTIPPGLPKGKYFLRFAIRTGHYAATHNSEKIELTIE